MTRSATRIPTLILAAFLFGGLGACATEQRTDSRREARVPAAPPGARPAQMFLSRGNPIDSNANGFVDTIPVLVYLFPEQNVSPLPVWADGEFEFELRQPSGERIARWVFPPEMVERSRQRLAPGPGFSFFLRLAPGEDRRPPATVDLVGVFRPLQGEEVRSTGAATVRIGAR